MRAITKQLAIENNQFLPLVDYLVPLVGDKKEVKILDIGSGPFPRTGQLLDGAKIDITHCDKQDFFGFWDEVGTTGLFPIEYQDMEKLSYADNSFDIVHSVNALDHTEDAFRAVKEMMRVSRGHVYINCNLDQRTTFRKKHYWDAKQDGTFENPFASFNLRNFGFDVRYIHYGPESHNDQITAIYSAPAATTQYRIPVLAYA